MKASNFNLTRSVLFATLFCLTAIVGCQKEDDPQVPGNVEFSFSGVENEGGKLSGAFNPAYVMVGIEDQNGTTIILNQILKLYSFSSEGFLSESIELEPGIYRLTDYLILDNDQNVIAATPKEGSVMSLFVDQPLPIEFEVTQGQSIMVKPQVIKVSPDVQASQLGYSVFSFDVLESDELYKKITSFEWQRLNQATQIFYTLKKWDFHYTDGLVTSITLTDNNSDGTPNVVREYTLTYNSNKRITEHTEYVNGSLTPTFRAEYFYDNFSRLSKVTHFSSSAMLLDEVYEYSDDYSMTIRRHSNTSEYNSPYVLMFDLDAMGNPVSMIHNDGQGNLVVSQNFAFDMKPNPLKAVQMRQMVGGFYFEPYFQPFTNAVSMEYLNGNGTSGIHTSIYTYDADNYPLTRILSQGSSQDKFIYTY